MEGYFFYRALVTVFDTDRMSAILHYIIGYGVPAIIILITGSFTLAGYEVYLKRDLDGDVTACFLSVEGMAAMVTPAVLVAVINCAVTAIAIYVAHNATSRRSYEISCGQPHLNNSKARQKIKVSYVVF